MLRSSRVFLLSLSFEAMALTTLDALEARLEGSRTAGSTRRLTSVDGSTDSCKGFAQPGVPFFISPKHDGVRLISSPHDAGRPVATSAGKVPHGSTCFSRYGRPIYGLFWIERELAMLRALCRDDTLVLDGELYIHRTATDREKLKASTPTSAASRKSKRLRGGPRSSTEPSFDDFKTGFLAVSALVHRLRGSTAQLATEADVLQYVALLPQFCLFDVPSYRPLPHSRPVTLNGHPLAKGQVDELERLWKQSLKNLGLRDVEDLRCIPNVTPFSQRLRTLHFLAELLHQGVRSPLLQVAYLNASPVPTIKSSHAAGTTPAELLPAYRGGHYVKMIPYHLARSIADAKGRLLPHFIAQGYEGAVIRTSSNLYEMREKRRGTVLELATVPSSARDPAPVRPPPGTHPPPPAGGSREAVCEADVRVAQVAADRAKLLSRRSLTAVKLLPFHDKEYPVLRPLLKEPSTNPRTRQLASIPLTEAFPDGGTDLVKKDPSTAGTGDGKPRTLTFYGLQCLSENGRVFNVSIPKMSAEKQEALLQHLLAAGRDNGGRSRGRGSGSASCLTGLYVTVKYSTLTEHGVPRFGTVKAIRGGKGWFL